MRRYNRRSFLRLAAAGIASAALGRTLRAESTAVFPPVRRITRGPKHHWFGYYDKLQFDPSNRFVLGMEVDFEHRSPTPDDVIKIGMVDIEDGDQWIELGESRAWCWQQGCMLQWLPGSKTKILWNDRDGDHFVCHILDVDTKERRTIPHAVYCVSPDGKTGVSTDFGRVNVCRPGYGYPGVPDKFAGDMAPKESGLFHINLESGESTLILSVADVVKIGTIPNKKPRIKHHLYHLLYNPDGSRFIALHRWNYIDGSRLTRLITLKPDGSDVRVVIPNGFASHFIWRDNTHILSQSKNMLGESDWGNFLFEDREGGTVEQIGKGVLDSYGHVSYLPGNEWILNDTYPHGPDRVQTPHLYHIAANRRIDLGNFPVPPEYTGEWRCDAHPRLSPNARYVCIDAPHQGEGRQLHLIDIDGLTS
ncbi:MAG: hypothetical protein HUU46_24985 [Candidatus Hydrogenedentes bacterium]|nr:hypothetical protein [Candidatus Hydrogenedentota bacterium]